MLLRMKPINSHFFLKYMYFATYSYVQYEIIKCPDSTHVAFILPCCISLVMRRLCIQHGYYILCKCPHDILPPVANYFPLRTHIVITNLPPTVGAGSVFSQPGINTIRMKNVLAAKLPETKNSAPH